MLESPRPLEITHIFVPKMRMMVKKRRLKPSFSLSNSHSMRLSWSAHDYWTDSGPPDGSLAAGKLIGRNLNFEAWQSLDIAAAAAK